MARKRKATRRRRAAPTHRRRRNTTPAVANPRRRSYRRRAAPKRRSYRRKRNPSLFGASVSTTKMAQAVVGGLVGVAGVKLIVPALPPPFNSSPAMRSVSSIAAAFLVGWAGGKVDRTFGDSMMFGGLMQAGSTVISSFFPGVPIALGDFVPGSFPVPQNPVGGYLPSPVADSTSAGMGTLSSAFSPAF